MSTIPLLAFLLIPQGTPVGELEGPTAGERLGASVAVVGDLDGDGLAEVLAGAPSFSSGAFTENGAARLISFAVPATPAILHTFEGEANGCHLGSAVAGIGDLNGDGIPDLLVGAPGETGAPGVVGSVHIFSGADFSPLLTPIAGLSDAELFGAHVAGLGDLNGDGKPEFLVAGPGEAGASGVIRVFSGADGSMLFQATGDLGANFGSAISAAQDADADGIADFLVGAPNTSPGGVNQAGEARLYAGGTFAVIRSWQGELAAENVGSSVASLGSGAAIGASGASDIDVASGRIVAYAGGKKGKELFKILGVKNGGGLGSSALGLGDVTGDGKDDLAVGEIGGGGTLAGVVHSYSGHDKTPLLLDTQTGDTGDQLGVALAMGDVDGDGLNDLVLGAPGHTTGKGLVRVLTLAGTGDAENGGLIGKRDLQRPFTAAPSDLRGKTEVGFKKKGKDVQQIFNVTVDKAEQGAALEVFMEDDAGSATFVDLGAMTAGKKKGTLVLELSDTGAPPAILGVSSLSQLPGRLVEVRDGATVVLRTRVPFLFKGKNATKKGKLEPIVSDSKAKGTATLASLFTVGSSTFTVQASGLDKTLAHSVEIETAVASGAFEVFATLDPGKSKVSRTTKNGDAMPFNVDSLGDLSGRKVEVRQGATVIVQGTLP